MASRSKSSAPVAAIADEVRNTEAVVTEATTQEETPVVIERDSPEVHSAKIAHYLDALTGARSGGIKDDGTAITFALEGASARLWFRIVKSTGNGFVKLYGTGNKTLGSKDLVFGRDGKQCVELVNKLRRAGDVRTVLAGKPISLDAPATQLALDESQIGEPADVATEVEASI